HPETGGTAQIGISQPIKGTTCRRAGQIRRRMPFHPLPVAHIHYPQLWTSRRIATHPRVSGRGLLFRRALTTVAVDVIHRGSPRFTRPFHNLARSTMTTAAHPDMPIWSTPLQRLSQDDRVSPQLHGFLSLVVPAGVMAGVLYLDVPNDLTAAQINKRLRIPLMEALATIGDEVASYRTVVNHELADQPTAPISV